MGNNNKFDSIAIPMFFLGILFISPIIIGAIFWALESHPVILIIGWATLGLLLIAIGLIIEYRKK